MDPYWYCEEYISKSSNAAQDELGLQIAHIEYVAELGCNFYLAAASAFRTCVPVMSGGNSVGPVLACHTTHCWPSWPGRTW